MKVFYFFVIDAVMCALYPTWFRWKIIKSESPSKDSYLYIPHGSDERGFIRPVIEGYLFFISHMVQMKELLLIVLLLEELVFISHMVQMKAPLSVVVDGLLYIPFISHMVQMKGLKVLFYLEVLTSLYPTWFRWKLNM